jgi:predicted Zn finger-like uncharacterized protein
VNVTCPDCRSIFRVDPAKVPLGGVRARCSVCGGVIAVSAPEFATAAAGAGTAPWTPSAAVETAAAAPFAMSHRVFETIETVETVDTIEGFETIADVSEPGLASDFEAMAEANAAREPDAIVGEPSVPPPMPGARPAGAPRPFPPAGVAGLAPPRAPIAPARPAVAPGSPLQPPRPSGSMPFAPARPTPSSAASGVDIKLYKIVYEAVADVRPALEPQPAAEPAAEAPVSTPHSPAAAVRPATPAAPAVHREAAATPVATPPSVSRVATPAPMATAPGGPAKRAPNPFLVNDPNQKARRLARALVSDMVAYLPQKREEGLRNNTLRQLFREEIRKSYEEYVDQVGREFAESTTHFQEALNDVLAGGKKIF